MISESSYWKEPLLKSASWLSQVRISESTQERTFIKIEKELFMGFYSVRKLLETAKVSDATKKEKYEVQWSPNTNPVNSLNRHEIDELYNLNVLNKETRDIGYICNLFIHSFIFLISSNGKLEGIYVTSDRIKNNIIYFISIKNILAIFRHVGHDYPSSVSYVRNPDTKEFDIYVS